MTEWKETEYGKIPFSWSTQNTEAYCIKVTDGTHDSPKEVPNGKPLITSKHIKGRNIDLQSAYHISQDDFDKIVKRSRVDQWDVIISMIGEYCGFCYIERNPNPEYAIKNVGLFKTGSEVKAKWLYYFLNSPIGKQTLEQQKSGTSQPYISLGSLRGLDIIIPSTEREQERIAEVLSSLDDKIDLLHRQNQTLEQLAETMFRHLFLDVRGDSEEISLIDLASHIKDGVNPNRSPETLFYHYSLPAFDNGRQPEKEYGRSILSNKYVVSSGDILISKLNPRTPRIWHVGEVEKSSICSTEFQVYRPKEKEYSEFVYCMLSSIETRDILASASSGTSGSHQRVTPDVINQLSIKRPDENSLRVFHQQAKEWFLKVSSNVKHIQLLEQTRDTLLPKLMSGTVRVNN